MSERSNGHPIVLINIDAVDAASGVVTALRALDFRLEATIPTAVTGLPKIGPDPVLLSLSAPPRPRPTIDLVPTIRRPPADVPIVVLAGEHHTTLVGSLFPLEATDLELDAIARRILAERLRFVWRAANRRRDLKESEAWLDTVRKIGRLGFGERSAITGQHSSSAEMQRPLGLDPSDQANLTGFDAIHPVDRSRIADAIASVRRQNPFAAFVTRIVSLHGIEPFPETRRVISRGNHGGAKVPSGTLHDATDRPDGEEPARALPNCDSQSGPNEIGFSDPALVSRASLRFAMVADLRRALEGGEFSLYYQPIADTVLGRATKLECLLRWNHPERGILSPDHFMEAAEAGGLVEALTAWTIHEACRQQRQWMALGYQPTLAINLFPRSFAVEGASERLSSIVGSAREQRSNLMLEVPEVLVETDPTLRKTLQHWKAIGFEICLDQFGCGLALKHLLGLPLDLVKVHPALARELPTNADARSMTEGIIAIATALQIEPLVEGVDQTQCHDILRSQGFRMMQGNLFGPPIDAAATTRLIREPRPELTMSPILPDLSDPLPQSVYSTSRYSSSSSSSSSRHRTSRRS